MNFVNTGTLSGCFFFASPGSADSDVWGGTLPLAVRLEAIGSTAGAVAVAAFTGCASAAFCCNGKTSGLFCFDGTTTEFRIYIYKGRYLIHGRLVSRCFFGDQGAFLGNCRSDGQHTCLDSRSFTFCTDHYRGYHMSLGIYRRFNWRAGDGRCSDALCRGLRCRLRHH